MENTKKKSFFNEIGFKATIDKLVNHISKLYLEDDIPWIVGYSGGVSKMLAECKPDGKEAKTKSGEIRTGQRRKWNRGWAKLKRADLPKYHVHAEPDRKIQDNTHDSGRDTRKRGTEVLVIAQFFDVWRT